MELASDTKINHCLLSFSATRVTTQWLKQPITPPPHDIPTGYLKFHLYLYLPLGTIRYVQILGISDHYFSFIYRTALQYCTYRQVQQIAFNTQPFLSMQRKFTQHIAIHTSRCIEFSQTTSETFNNFVYIVSMHLQRHQPLSQVLTGVRHRGEPPKEATEMLSAVSVSR